MGVDIKKRIIKIHRRDKRGKKTEEMFGSNGAASAEALQVQ